VTGFSAEWLALREPADHRARNPELLAALARLFSDRKSVRVLDLGSGSGSNLRGTAPHLPLHQNWRLVDYDPGLIAAAQHSLSAWAQETTARGGTLRLARHEHVLDVEFRLADLASGVEGVLDEPADLVTAAAFFDLVSAEWIERFAAAIAARRLPLYTVLIYNGDEAWDPPHPSDRSVNAAFNLHQQTDKGFGAAAGPRAAGILATALRAKGYHVVLGDSAWRLGTGDRALMAPLANGIAEAAKQTGQVPPAELLAWEWARLAVTACVIGHTDLLAVPPA
jgi:hypothetical protein